MTQYSSIIKLRGSTGQAEFQFDFPYLKREDIKVFVEGAQASFSFLSSNTIELDTPLQAASNVVIRRYTDHQTRLVDFNNVAELTEDDLDADSLQAFYLVQEALDTATEAVVKDAAGNWDAGMGRIMNVGDAVSDYDAMNLRTFHALNEAYNGKFSETLQAAREAVQDAVDQADRSRSEADRAYAIKEETQDLHDATDAIRNDARAEAIKAQNERLRAEQAVVDAQVQADNSKHWYEVFKMLYLGVRSEHPGGEVINGAVYFNATENRLYFYSGTNWFSPTTDAERAEASRIVAETVRDEIIAIRSQVYVYTGQAQEAAGQAIDSANSAALSAGKAAASADEAKASVKAAEGHATVAKGHATVAETARREAVAAADVAVDAASAVSDAFVDKGSWSVASGMPSVPTHSSMWTCMSGGDLNGVEWVEGDMLVYSIKTSSWGRLSGSSVEGTPPTPVEFFEDVILAEGKKLTGRVGSKMRSVACVDAEGVKLGDEETLLHLLGDWLLFGEEKHKVFHEGHLPSWDQITDKPSVFPTSDHTHGWDSVTDKPQSATRWPTWYEVSDKPSTFPSATHEHPWSEVTNKPDTAMRWPTPAEVGALPSTGGTIANSDGVKITFGSVDGNGSQVAIGANNKLDFSIWNSSSDNAMRFGWRKADGTFDTRFAVLDDNFICNYNMKINKNLSLDGTVGAVRDISSLANIYTNGGWVGAYPDGGARGFIQMGVVDELVHEGWHSRVSTNARSGWTIAGTLQDAGGSCTHYCIATYNPAGSPKYWKFRWDGATHLPGTLEVDGITTITRNTGAGWDWPGAQLVVQNQDGGDVGISFHRAGHTAATIRHGTDGNFYFTRESGSALAHIMAGAVHDSGHRVYSPVNQPTHLVRKNEFAEYTLAALGNFDSGDFNLGDWSRFDIIRIFSSGQNDNHIVLNEFTKTQWDRMQAIADAAQGAQGTFNIVAGSGRSWVITSVPWGHYLLQWRTDNCRIRAIELGRYW